MDIFLIRHTRADITPGLCYGQSDVPLAGSFAEETKEIHKKMPPLAPDGLIISSPLSRCLQLAQTFTGHCQIDDRIQEIHFGDWENQRFDDLNAEQLKHWTDNFVNVAPPNGESFNDLCQRVSAFWDELLSAKPGGQIIIVTHAGVIRALLALVLELKPEHAFKFSVNPGSIHKLRRRDDYTYIHQLNL